jgi:hypothetical protein
VVPLVVPKIGSRTTLVGGYDSKWFTGLHDWFPWWFPKLTRELLVRTVSRSKTSGTTGNHLGEPLVQVCFQPLKPNADILE